MFSCADAGGVSTTATVTIILKETNDFAPQLFPLSGTICQDADPTGSGLVLTAVDEDLAPHAAPFTFDIPDDQLTNWTVVQVNGKEKKSHGGEDGVESLPLSPKLIHSLFLLPLSGTHAILHPRVKLEEGEYAVTVLVSDSGIPVLGAYAQVNVTVCLCDSFGDCKSEAGAVVGSSVGISFIALIIIMASIALLLCKPHVEFIPCYQDQLRFFTHIY